ncbi:hypothetical protein NSMM_400134 [Nitrosomonas mobilis]|uniref:Uncharacterized protein n=1 Tax=Nitrosomonas mobilis TaxID=51642 RepID=A0A1G5SEM0_9PROT|nr:hypothetical protein NSMM_400134 [Nitrosomonas mobilis]
MIAPGRAYPDQHYYEDNAAYNH